MHAGSVSQCRCAIGYEFYFRKISSNYFPITSIHGRHARARASLLSTDLISHRYHCFLSSSHLRWPFSRYTKSMTTKLKRTCVSMNLHTHDRVINPNSSDAERNTFPIITLESRVSPQHTHSTHTHTLFGRPTSFYPLRYKYVYTKRACKVILCVKNDQHSRNTARECNTIWDVRSPCTCSLEWNILRARAL